MRRKDGVLPEDMNAEEGRSNSLGLYGQEELVLLFVSEPFVSDPPDERSRHRSAYGGARRARAAAVSCPSPATNRRPKTYPNSIPSAVGSGRRLQRTNVVVGGLYRCQLARHERPELR